MYDARMREACGSGGGSLRRQAMRLAAMTMEQLDICLPVDALPSGAVEFGAVGAAGAHPHVTDLRFDRSGELLASCSSSGTLALHTLDQLLATMPPLPPPPSPDAPDALARAPPTARAVHKPPIFAVRTELRPRTVRWHPAAPDRLRTLGSTRSSSTHALGSATNAASYA